MAPRDPVVTRCGQWWGCHGRLAGGGIGFDRDDADSAFGQEFKAHVAAALGPFVALFGQHGADEPDCGRAAGEDADDVGAPADLFVQSFLGVVAPDLAPDWRQISRG